MASMKFPIKILLLLGIYIFLLNLKTSFAPGESRVKSSIGVSPHAGAGLRSGAFSLMACSSSSSSVILIMAFSLSKAWSGNGSSSPFWTVVFMFLTTCTGGGKVFLRNGSNYKCNTGCLIISDLRLDNYNFIILWSWRPEVLHT